MAQRPFAGPGRRWLNPPAPRQCSRRSRTAPTLPMRKKSDLPQKTCLHCGLPFTWRRKWEKVWDEVKYCSERCRGERKRGGGAAAAPAGDRAA